MEEKRQRLEERKQRESSASSSSSTAADALALDETSTAPTTFASKVPDEKPEPADAQEPDHTASSSHKKTLKIEVHATATHHERVEPIVAHAQQHDLSHNQAVSGESATI